MTSLRTQPLVSFGVPVYNGELHLEASVRSLQTQTWSNLEILISDNASTDGTEAICRRLAASDPRIRYLRQPVNLGAAGNFDLVAREARGALFAWCAHDDLHLPRFVEACAAELERRPDAVVCNPAVAFLDEEGRIRPDWKDSNFETRSSTRPERAQRLIDHVDWVDVYGLVRRDALLAALPYEPIFGSDVVLTMRLLMLGEFAKVQETLFHYRVRPLRQRTDQMRQERVRNARPYTGMIRALLSVAMQAAADHAERAELLRRFLRTLTDLGREGPHASWRGLLGQEHRAALGADPARETFPRHLLGWLAEGLPGPAGGREALALVLADARRALIAVPGHAEDLERVPALVSALRARLPRATFGVLCPEPCAARLSGADGLEAVLPFAPLPDAASGPSRDRDPELARVRDFGADLVFCPSTRRTLRMDKLATRSGALLGFTFHQPAIDRSRWYRRRTPYDPNRHWGFVLPGRGEVAELMAFLDRADPCAEAPRSNDALCSSGRP